LTATIPWPRTSGRASGRPVRTAPACITGSPVPVFHITLPVVLVERRRRRCPHSPPPDRHRSGPNSQIPMSGIFAPSSVATFFCHTTAPVAASRQMQMPRAQHIDPIRHPPSASARPALVVLRDPGDARSCASTSSGRVTASRPRIVSSLPSLPRVYAFPPATETEEKPFPTFAVQSTFGPSPGKVVVQPFSEEIPLRCGPRQCGQSPGRPSVSPARTQHRRRGTGRKRDGKGEETLKEFIRTRSEWKTLQPSHPFLAGSTDHVNGPSFRVLPLAMTLGRPATIAPHWHAPGIRAVPMA
jgi:hypothetical protein